MALEMEWTTYHAHVTLLYTPWWSALWHTGTSIMTTHSQHVVPSYNIWHLHYIIQCPSLLWFVAHQHTCPHKPITSFNTYLHVAEREFSIFVSHYPNFLYSKQEEGHKRNRLNLVLLMQHICMCKAHPQTTH